jgi:hypothetical protein
MTSLFSPSKLGPKVKTRQICDAGTQDGLVPALLQTSRAALGNVSNGLSEQANLCNLTEIHSDGISSIFFENR